MEYVSWNMNEFNSSFWVELACAFSGVTGHHILTSQIFTGSKMPHYQPPGDTENFLRMTGADQMLQVNPRTNVYSSIKLSTAHLPDLVFDGHQQKWALIVVRIEVSNEVLVSCVRWICSVGYICCVRSIQKITLQSWSSSQKKKHISLLT